jgi:hypothetical protein
VFVDEAFVELLKEKFGERKWSMMESRTRHRLIHDEWEHGIKPTFDGRDRTWVFNMPFECMDLRSMRTGAARPKVTVTADDVRDVFDPTVDKIWTMVDQQVSGIKQKTKKDPIVSLLRRHQVWLHHTALLKLLTSHSSTSLWLGALVGADICSRH